MGDAFNNTPWDVLLIALIVGGVPTLIVGIPLAVIAILDWRIHRRLRAGSGRVLPPIDKAQADHPIASGRQ